MSKGLKNTQKLVLQALLVCSFMQIALAYDSFKIGWSNANLSEQKGSYGSKNISGILFGLERGWLYDNLVVAAYLEGNVWPLSALSEGGYYSIGTGGKIGYNFAHTLPYIALGAEYMSLYYTDKSDNQKNIGGLVAQIGADFRLADEFGLGIAIKSSVPDMYRNDGRYRLFGVVVYFVYQGF
ncbi:hypothetical protein [uncultured Helicobacter sp.]|uniref:hypothetical protein n=1 Tax=uncultured Helicobacter sp. TaxID=175537 RepID=UPI00374E665A